MSHCLSNPLVREDTDGPRVYLLGVHRQHPRSAAQVGAVLDEVGWDNAHVVFACTRRNCREEEDQQEGVWLECQTTVAARAKAEKEAAWHAAPKQVALKIPGHRNLRRRKSKSQQAAKAKVQGIGVEFWCGEYSELALSRHEQEAWKQAITKQAAFNQAADRIETWISKWVPAFFRTTPNRNTGKKLEYKLQELADRRLRRKIEEATAIFDRFEESYEGQRASPDSLLRYVQDHETAGSDHVISRLSSVGMSVEDALRSQALDNLNRDAFNLSSPIIRTSRVSKANHIAAVVQEIVVPAAGDEGGAVVIVVDDLATYHTLATKPEVWGSPHPLPVPCEPRTSTLQQLLDIQIMPYVNHLAEADGRRKDLINTDDGNDIREVNLPSNIGLTEIQCTFDFVHGCLTELMSTKDVTQFCALLLRRCYIGWITAPCSLKTVSRSTTREKCTRKIFLRSRLQTKRAERI